LPLPGKFAATTYEWSAVSLANRGHQAGIKVGQADVRRQVGLCCIDHERIADVEINFIAVNIAKCDVSPSARAVCSETISVKFPKTPANEPVPFQVGT
jgi:hypothetical protein